MYDTRVLGFRLLFIQNKKKSMYKIKSWCPNRENQMGGSAFSILLTPKWKEAVCKSDITQEYVDEILNSDLCKTYMRQHGFGERYSDIRISWGEWGIEHITVPGNACGLDIEYHPIGYWNGEVSLDPHNIDSIYQASLILTIFLLFAEMLEGFLNEP